MEASDKRNAAYARIFGGQQQQQQQGFSAPNVAAQPYAQSSVYPSHVQQQQQQQPQHLLQHPFFAQHHALERAQSTRTPQSYAPPSPRRVSLDAFGAASDAQQYDAQQYHDYYGQQYDDRPVASSYSTGYSSAVTAPSFESTATTSPPLASSHRASFESTSTPATSSQQHHYHNFSTSNSAGYTYHSAYDRPTSPRYSVDHQSSPDLGNGYADGFAKQTSYSPQSTAEQFSYSMASSSSPHRLSASASSSPFAGTVSLADPQPPPQHLIDFPAAFSTSVYSSSGAASPPMDPLQSRRSFESVRTLPPPAMASTSSHLDVPSLAPPSASDSDLIGNGRAWSAGAQSNLARSRTTSASSLYQDYFPQRPPTPPLGPYAGSPAASSALLPPSAHASGGPQPRTRHSSSSTIGRPMIAPHLPPLVYPALLSRVADEFKARIVPSERVKDGLMYSDCFDGRDAVDKIAYIIRTSDRNLALLLGRALDAQKLFHDVTYDHRLRDSPFELYQFRERLSNPFLSGEEQQSLHTSSSQLALYSGGGLAPHSAPSQPPALPPKRSSISETVLSDDASHPCGVFTLLSDCYSPTCTRDRLCYSIACPRRLEQQARLNLKPKPGLQRSISSESLGEDDREPGSLWAHNVPSDVLAAVSEGEKKRQEAINEVIYTERDFVRDLEYLREFWIKPLLASDIIPESRREHFVNQVFWNVLEIHSVNARLCELLNKRQRSAHVVESIGDIFLELVPHFAPFVKYGAHQLYGKFEFEKEKASNPAFAKFVDEVERKPESRKLELNGYLTKPITRLARYPLLLEACLKHTAEDNPDKTTLPKVVKLVREFLTRVNVETGKSENRFNLAQLDQQLVFRMGEAVDLRLRDPDRELIFKGAMRKRGGTQSENAELQVFLFDHALLMVKQKSKHEQYKVYRKPIPLELLVVNAVDESSLGKAAAARPKSLISRTTNSKSSSMPPPSDKGNKQGYALTFIHLGRRGYHITLWLSTWASRKKWLDLIDGRQADLRDRSLVFEVLPISEGYFVGTNRVLCAAPFDHGNRIAYGTENGVYLADLRDRRKMPVKVVAVVNVTQLDVLEEFGILIVLADKAVQTFYIDHLDPSDAVGAAKRARKISSHATFFRTGQCLGRTLVCIVKSGSVSSTIKALEPIDVARGKKQPALRKFLQGGSEYLRVFKEFYIPTESSSIHFLKSKLCVGCTKGFEIVDLETLDTQGLLDPADSSLDFVHRRETARPIAIYRIEGDFLLCYDEFAFYVNKNGWRARSSWLVQWEGHPTTFALHYPYVLAFEPTFVEVRHVESGALVQIIPGHNLRCLFADSPPSSSALLSMNPSTAVPYFTDRHGRPFYPQGRSTARNDIIVADGARVFNLRMAAALVNWT